MPRRFRSLPLLLLALVPLVGAGQAAAQSVESQVRARSEDDHAPIYDETCDPSASAVPDEGCGCDVGGIYDLDEKCIDGDLFRFSNAPGERIAAGSFACDVDSCAFPGDPPDHGLGVAETDYGANFVHVFSEDRTFDPWVTDAGGAVSRWSDSLAATSAAPIADATVRATFRVRGSWQNAPCFVVHAEVYSVGVVPAVQDRAVFSSSQGFPGATLCLMPSGSTGTPPGFTDYDAEDGAIDLAIPLEIPLALPSTVRLFAELRAWANGEDSVLDGTAGGLEMIVERVEVPLGVELESAAGALDAYHVPEPGGAAGAAAAAALAALRRRRSGRSE